MEVNLPVLQPSRTTLMIKPVGAACNLRCTYCYYLDTPDKVGCAPTRMSLATLEAIFAGYLPDAGPEVQIAWQGGEPTLAGLDFFKQAIYLQQKYARPGQTIAHAFQTNGTLLDDAWCEFLAEYNFLIGISIDGPPAWHDQYRVDSTRNAEGTHHLVERGLRRLRQHRVEHNVLTVLNDRNVQEPDALYSYLLRLGEKWMQFIPCVEWETDPVTGEPTLAPYSPDGEAYGKFLCKVFDRWFARDRGTVSIRIFDSILQTLVRGRAAECTFAGACHNQLTIEGNGDVYGCDHYVEDGYRLGSVLEGNGRWLDNVDTHALQRFAMRKSRLTDQCLACDHRDLCEGGCPKHRPYRGDRATQNVLCPGYHMLFEHARDKFEWLAGYLRRHEQPPPPRATSGGSGARRRRVRRG